jgi:hypothetical protein
MYVRLLASPRALCTGRKLLAHHEQLSSKHTLQFTDSLALRNFVVMLKSQSLVKRLCLLATLLVCCSFAVQAQTTVLNTPSTDVQTTQTTYVEADFIGHLTSFEKGGFQVYGSRVLYGVRKKLEVGVNLLYTKAEGAPQSVEIQPNAKWQFYQNEDSGVAVAAGGVLFLPVPHHHGSDTTGLVYLTASKKVKASYGPRFTGGAYRMVGLSAGSKGGGILGYEQPLHHKLTLLADWYSGQNRLGYASAGLGATMSTKSVLYVCYSFGNTGRGNNALGIFYGWTF